MFKPVGSIIANKGRYGKSSEAILALQVRGAAKKILEGICADLGEGVVKSAKVKSFKNGVLNIVAPGLLSAELYMRSGELKKAINEELGGVLVKDLRFKNF